MPVLTSTPSTEMTEGMLRDQLEHEEAIKRLGVNYRPQIDEDEEFVSTLIYDIMQLPQARKKLLELVAAVYTKRKLKPPILF